MQLTAFGITAILATAALALAAGCGGSAGSFPAASDIVSRASQVMATRSFSVAPCSTCNSTETLQYAPPDAVELAHSGGHDAWEYNLVVGNRWFVSSLARRWLEGPALEHIGMVVGDPRILLRFARQTAVDEGKSTGATYVVRSSVDREGLISYMLKGKNFDSATTRDFTSVWGEEIAGIRVGFWVDRQTFVVSMVEIDYPLLKTTPDPEVINPPTPGKPPTAIIKFNYSSPVDVPINPVSMPGADVHRLDKQARDDERPILQALEAYKRDHGAYPPELTPTELGPDLTQAWPTNPYSGQPMKQTSDGSPGDFAYQPQQGGAARCLRFYGWNDALGTLGQNCRFNP